MLETPRSVTWERERASPYKKKNVWNVTSGLSSTLHVGSLVWKVRPGALSSMRVVFARHLLSHDCCEFSCSRRSPAIHMLKKWDSINTWIYSWHLLPGSPGVCMNGKVRFLSLFLSLCNIPTHPVSFVNLFLFKARVRCFFRLLSS